MIHTISHFHACDIYILFFNVILIAYNIKPYFQIDKRLKTNANITNLN